jgi:hypothetical protein
VTAVVTLGWLIALIVLLSVGSALPGDVHWWIWTCVAGLVMGLFGLWYVPFLKRRRARFTAEHERAAEAQLSGSLPAASESLPPASGYVSRDSGSNTVSSTETPGKSTRS